MAGSLKVRISSVTWVIAVLLAAAMVVYALYFLVLGMEWNVVSEVSPGGSPTRTTVRLPHFAAGEPLVAAALVLAGLLLRRMLLAWIGAAALLVVAGLLVFSIGLPLLPAAGLLLVYLTSLTVVRAPQRSARRPT